MKRFTASTATTLGSSRRAMRRGRDHIAADGHSLDRVTRLNAACDASPLLPSIWLQPRICCCSPVMILTALDQEPDRIEGLKAGTDDWFKPFDRAELSAPTDLSHAAMGVTQSPVRLGWLEIDLAARSLRKDGRPVPLSRDSVIPCIRL